jgi:hypothetical protein
MVVFKLIKEEINKNNKMEITLLLDLKTIILVEAILKTRIIP